MKKIIIEETNKGIRLDKYLTQIEPEKSRTVIQDLITSGLILVNNQIVKTGYITKTDDEITILDREPINTDLEPQNLNLRIVYQDTDVVVVDKPSGMVVHPAVGNFDQTLVNGLLYELKDLSTIKGDIRPGIVHRIDKDTSGLLMVAKNDETHVLLSDQLKNHEVNRIYIGLVYGVIQEEKGRIDAPIGRDKSDRKKMAVVEDGKRSITNFQVIKRFKNFTLVEFKLETGRTHQIRVHMKYIGYPLVGDPTYGLNKLVLPTGQLLHAKTLGFVHPKTKEYMEFHSEIPDYFSKYLETLE